MGFRQGFFRGIIFLSSALAGTVHASGADLTSSDMKVYAFRLHPGEDLLGGIRSFVAEHHLQAAVVLTAVGSLKTAKIRFADKNGGTALSGPFEIVSLVGTLEAQPAAGAHLHISISDGEGKTYGGHLMEGSKIYTTAEISLGELKQLRFVRRVDPQTTYQELSIERRP